MLEEFSADCLGSLRKHQPDTPDFLRAHWPFWTSCSMVRQTVGGMLVCCGFTGIFVLWNVILICRGDGRTFLTCFVCCTAHFQISVYWVIILACSCDVDILC